MLWLADVAWSEAGTTSGQASAERGLSVPLSSPVQSKRGKLTGDDLGDGVIHITDNRLPADLLLDESEFQWAAASLVPIWRTSSYSLRVKEYRLG